ncbi:MAG: hypothetical protein FWE09_06015 [Treponema sp.]|nr:hypothetical protein [Treponema sp.]
MQLQGVIALGVIARHEAPAAQSQSGAPPRDAPAQGAAQAAGVQPAQGAQAALVARSAGALAAAVAAAGLPADGLSSAIVSFASFFSLPIRPDVMSAIRRQALPQNMSGAKEDASDRQARALASAAAESKGARLSEKALDAYARALDPDGGKREGERGEKNPTRDRLNAGAAIDPGQLRESALEAEKKAPALAALNRMRGRDGRRWIALPFEFEREGRGFKVSMRLLLDEPGNGLMVLDIAPEDGGRKWLFSLSYEDGQCARLIAYVDPDLATGDAAGRIAGEIADLMGIPSGHVSLQERALPFPVEAEPGAALRGLSESA